MGHNIVVPTAHEEKHRVVSNVPDRGHRKHQA